MRPKRSDGHSGKLEKGAYLDFDSINIELENYYNNLDGLYFYLKKSNTSSIEKQKKTFFQIKAWTINRLIERIHYDDPEQWSTALHYADVGILYEHLIKTCLLKNDWEHYLAGYNKIKTFEGAKNELLKTVKGRLTKVELERLTQIINIVQRQRNNCIHGPIKSFDHYALKKQIYLGVITLDQLFTLNIYAVGLLATEFDQPNIVPQMNLDFKPAGLERFLINEKILKLKKKWEKIDDRKRLILQTESLDPDNKTEDDDGTFYPKEILTPDIAFVPPAEGHTIITDVDDDPKEWHYIQPIITQLAKQSFTCYYRGMYLASFMCSANCIELTLKYELIRRGKLKPEELENRLTFGSILETKKNELKQIGLGMFWDRLKIVSDLRAGLFHFNPKRLKDSTLKILYTKRPLTYVTEVNFFSGRYGWTESAPTEDYTVPADNYHDWSRLANYSYNLMRALTQKLYGAIRKSKNVKMALKDYEKRRLHEDFTSNKLMAEHYDKKYQYLKQKMREE